MKKLLFALLFLAGGVSHEIRHPVSCHAIGTRQPAGPRKHRGG